MGTTCDHIWQYWNHLCQSMGVTRYDLKMSTMIGDDWTWWQDSYNPHGWDTSIEAKWAWEDGR